MGLFDFFKKPQAPEPFAVSTFECARDGLTIRGTEYRPQGENLPVAIVCHGFMAWQDTVRQYAKELARQGYCAFTFDFCGGSVGNRGKSDGKTTDMSVLTEVQDLESVIAYTRSLSYTGDHLLLMGASQGGFVSALTASKHPTEVNKLALLYPALCIPDDARAGKMMFAKFDPNNIPEIVDCGPMKLGRRYVADVVHMDPYQEITGYTGPVLLIHGTKDRIVNISFSQQAEEAYKAAGANIAYKVIPDGAHGFNKKHDAMALQYLRSFVE